MKTRIKKALEEATVSTFEDICFMYPVPELKEIQKNMKLEAAAEVKYRGNFNGKLIIETRGDLLSAITANILSDDFPSSQQKNDALGEIANIICGNIVPYLGRGGKGYKIQSPKSLNKNELSEEKKQGTPVAKITLNFDQGRADIKFFVDGDLAVKEKKR